MIDSLSELGKYSRISADTAEYWQLSGFPVSDATTNPTLILRASKKAEASSLLYKAVCEAKIKRLSYEDTLALSLEKTSVAFGIEVLKRTTGTVSTQLDPRLSYDTLSLCAQARRIIHEYRSHGIDTVRVRIKIPATWEGIRAAELLEKEGIFCNMTLLFSLVQALSSAQAKADMIAPYVGRITDWHRKLGASEGDAGVARVKEIFQTIKSLGYRTKVMAASFRTPEQVLALCGCDYLTISLALLSSLQNLEAPSPKQMTICAERQCQIEKSQALVLNKERHCQKAKATRKIDLAKPQQANCHLFGARVNKPICPLPITQSSPLSQLITKDGFERSLKEEFMATELLAQGILLFTQDYLELENILSEII